LRKEEQNNNNNTPDSIHSAVIMTTRSLREFTIGSFDECRTRWFDIMGYTYSICRFTDLLYKDDV